MSYHDTVQEVYRRAAESPESNLCCVPQAPRYLPGLHIPPIMHEMNYGCGTTIHLQDMVADQRALYVGVGGGLEALQLAYFTRRPGGVIAVDPVAQMRQVARRNLELAAETNDWFDPDFVRILDGDALALPLENVSVDFAAQNCLFNIFTTDGDLEKALCEIHRVLAARGRLVMSDPITPRPLPPSMVNNEVLRAQCISGCLTLEEYLKKIVEAGFGTIEIRRRAPYRLLDIESFGLDQNVLLDTIELAAFKVSIPNDGPCVFTGRTAIYSGPEVQFDDGCGHVLLPNVPLPVCDKTAAALRSLEQTDITVTAPTWHYQGDGCC